MNFSSILSYDNSIQNLENKEIYPNQLPPQNPYFAYPADYYEDEYELDDEDEWEDDDEWEEED